MADTRDCTEDPSFAHKLNFQVLRRRRHLFEIADQKFCPGFLRNRIQSILTGQWTCRIPVFQKVSPAELAIDKLSEVLEHVIASSDSSLTVVDFCSGGGGPTPFIERSINAQRAEQGLRPVQFLLTDLHPHISDWMKLSEQSDFLGFIPQPVNAAEPPVSVISENSPQNDTNAEFSSDRRIFRLFFLSFHHFNDEMATKILASSLKTADAFAIFELQDRHVSSLILMLLEPFFILLVALFWFITDPLLLIFTYLIPLLPPIMAFDGLVSCLRTRTFNEILELVDCALDGRDPKQSQHTQFKSAYRNMHRRVKRGQWIFEGGRVLHTYPFGHMSWFIGWREPQERENGDLIEL